MLSGLQILNFINLFIIILPLVYIISLFSKRMPSPSFKAMRLLSFLITSCFFVSILSTDIQTLFDINLRMLQFSTALLGTIGVSVLAYLVLLTHKKV